MSFELPPRPKNRLAVLRVLAFALSGTLLLLALVVEAVLTAPATVFSVPSPSLPSAMERWGFDASHLILTMPLGAVIVLFSRVVIGIDTFGIFTPMLMALAFMQLGPLLGPLAMGLIILLGALIVPLLDRFNVTRMGMMAVLIGVVALIQYALQRWYGGALLDTSFPIVISALVVERWWITHQSEGRIEAASLASATILLAIIIQFALAGTTLRAAVASSPYLVPLIAIIAALLLSRYRGLRLTELNRFTTVLEEDRGSARN
ncbi:7TM domain-containing protein [Erythrobacter sp. YT30]|uniref:7TM domain-containing protein n=1 Tax=Erythrobacter sp. YT30 TaxID=1735012 RepID=UPI00076CD0FA|nr:7TM domain-containing protein [Erythrobacter sp. YT30]KWV91551.1 hypothetical protein AUC45_09975 [Erythrobacter sp. YT30]